MKKIKLYILIGFSILFQTHVINAQEGLCLTDEVAAEMMQNNAGLRSAAAQNLDRILQLEQNGSANMRAMNDIVIPMVFHIVHQCGDEQINDQQIINAIEDINIDFSAQNKELSQFATDLPTLGVYPAAVNLEFKLATLDPDGYPTTGITRTQHFASYNGMNMEIDLKKLIQWDPDKYLNVWVVKSAGGLASAYAQFPSLVDHPATRVLDGIVINHSYLSTTGTASERYKRRHILTHEIGHWAGLFHCWGTTNSFNSIDNCNDDDEIQDTGNTIGDQSIVYPRDTTMDRLYLGVDKFNYSKKLIDPNVNTNNNGALEITDLPKFCSNSNPLYPYSPIFNFMDYGAEFYFSAGQVQRMNTVLNSSVANRNEIGLLSERHFYFIDDSNNLTTITTSGVYFMEKELNDGSFLEDGIDISLSEGSFNFSQINSSTTNYFSVTGLPTNTNLEITRDANDPSKATVRLLGNALNHEVNSEIIITFSSSAISSIFPLYKDSIHFKTNFIKGQFINYSVFDISNQDYSRPVYSSSVKGPDTMYAGIFIERVGYLAIEYFDDPAYQGGNTYYPPSGFYLVNESERPVEALCNNASSYPRQIAYLDEGFNINQTAPSGYKYETINSTPGILTDNGETEALLILEDNQTFVEDTIVSIGIKISSDCNQNEVLGWIRVKFFADGKTIEVLDGLVNYDPSIQSLVLENPPCTPSVNNDNFLWINSFELLDTNGEGIINNTTSTQSYGYTDYSNVFADPSKTIVMSKNDCYQTKITRTNNTTSAFFYIWIDFDDDSFFEVDEKVLSDRILSGGNLNTNLCLPENATYGEHKMRVGISVLAESISSNGAPQSSINPCGTIYGGEYEDYTVYIYDECEETMRYSSYISVEETNVSGYIVCEDNVVVKNNQQILLNAGDSICLNDGFDANAANNVLFEGFIQDCNSQNQNCRSSDSLALVSLYNSTAGTNWLNTWNLNLPVSSWYGVTLSNDGCNVTDLNLSNNNLTGTIPSQIGNLNALESFCLFFNNLSGNIPSEISNLHNLKIIQLLENNLSGPIPPGIGSLTNLEQLSLSANNFSGEIPNSFGGLVHLNTLYISHNNLSGCYPIELCSLSLYHNLQNFSFEANSGLPNGGASAGFTNFCNGNASCPANKWDNKSSIEENIQSKHFDVNAYPNPVTTSIIFDLTLVKESDEIYIQIVDIQGNILQEFSVSNLTIGKNSIEHDTEYLSPGIYNYIISNNSDKVIGKFIKSN